MRELRVESAIAAAQAWAEHQKAEEAKQANAEADYEYLRDQVIVWLQQNTLTYDGVYWYSHHDALRLAADALLRQPALRALLLRSGIVP